MTVRELEPPTGTSVERKLCDLNVNYSREASLVKELPFLLGSFSASFNNTRIERKEKGMFYPPKFL